MQREYHHWWSNDLGREMELLTFGHAGWPMIVFPTSMGTFYEYENAGMVGAIADKIDAGVLRLFCVSTIDRESFYGGHLPPRRRIDHYLAYERYLLTDVVGLVRTMTGSPTAGVTGCSFGAYHAFTMALRHPDVFTSCVTMGGAFDITRFLDGYYDRDVYLLCPPHFLPNLSDDWFLGRIRRNKWVFVTGDEDMCRGETEWAAHLLAEKQVTCSLHVWTHGSVHDWPEWRKMARAYLP